MRLNGRIMKLEQVEGIHAVDITKCYIGVSPDDWPDGPNEEHNRKSYISLSVEEARERGILRHDNENP